jgi:hypothetical protein
MSDSEGSGRLEGQNKYGRGTSQAQSECYTGRRVARLNTDAITASLTSELELVTQEQKGWKW